MQEIVFVSKKVYIKKPTGEKAILYSCGPPTEPLNRDWVLIEIYHAIAPDWVSHYTIDTVDPATLTWCA